MQIKDNKKRLDYKWVIVALSLLMVMVSLGFASSTRSLFVDEIAKELGIERSLISIGESFRYVSTAVVNLLFGFLIAKFGPKKLAFCGLLSLSLGALVYGLATNIAMIYIAGTLFGIGFSWTSTTMVGYIVDLWCSENKGTIMGLILASNGIGGAVAIQIIGNIINPEITGSYREGYFVIAGVLLAVAIIILLFFRAKPKESDIKEKPVSVKKKKKRGQDWSGFTFNELLKKPYFWCAIVCIFFTGFILQGTYGIAAMHMKDVGIDYDAVKAVLSFSSLLLTVSKFLTGFIYDKTGIRFAASICSIFAIIATLMLASIENTSLGFIIAIVAMIFTSLAMPLETIMLPLYVSDLCGRKDYAKVLGIIVSINTAGYALGAPAMNLAYDLLGSYKPALFAVGFIFIGVLTLLQFVVSAAHKERRALEEKLLLEEENEAATAENA